MLKTHYNLKKKKKTDLDTSFDIQNMYKNIPNNELILIENTKLKKSFD